MHRKLKSHEESGFVQYIWKNWFSSFSVLMWALYKSVRAPFCYINITGFMMDKISYNVKYCWNIINLVYNYCLLKSQRRYSPESRVRAQCNPTQRLNKGDSEEKVGLNRKGNVLATTQVFLLSSYLTPPTPLPSACLGEAEPCNTERRKTEIDVGQMTANKAWASS